MTGTMYYLLSEPPTADLPESQRKHIHGVNVVDIGGDGRMAPETLSLPRFFRGVTAFVAADLL